MKKLTTLIVLVSSLIQLYAQDGYKLIDAFPTNIGGKEEFKRVFEQELIYPETSLSNKTERHVTINFTIAKDSSVSNISIVSSGDKAIDDEALRIFKLYQWIPAQKQGGRVSTGWTVNFDFDPTKYSKMCRQRGYKALPSLSNEKVDTSNAICKTPDQLPLYPKGGFALADFIKENLEYPRQAQLANLQGTVVLRFVVETSGLITNIGIDQSVGGGCDQEAIRVLKLIKWYPAKKDEKLVRAETTFPFNFILNNEFKDNSASEQK